jgi:hypothetical protein
VGQTSNAQLGWLADGSLGRRTVAEIQRKVIKRSGRNAVSRLFRAKNDKETIAAWKLDLDRILQVFNVGSVLSAWLLLTINFQTELAVNMHVTVSDIRHDVANTHTVVSGIRDDVSKILEGIGSQVHSEVHSVSAFNLSAIGGCLQFSRPKPGQKFQLPRNPVSYICI